MRIAELIRRHREARRPFFSFEFFPPKTTRGEEQLYAAIDELRPLEPAYVSVTYGAGGSTRDKTIEWVDRIRREHGVEAMAHLTCVGASRDDLSRILDSLSNRGIENILALRGDPPRGDANFRPDADGFAHAVELVRFIRSRHAEFSTGVAGYPEKHPEAPDLATDISRLREKVSAGADFVVTQLFFEPRMYFDFLRRIRDAGGWDGDPEGLAARPVIPGIMPLTSKSQIEKFIAMCGATVPEELRRAVEAAESDEAVAEIGVAHATRMARELLAGGAPGIHFYTLNKSSATKRILSELRRNFPVAENGAAK